MGSIRDAIKIVEKTPEEIEAIKAEIQKAGLPDEMMAVILYGLNLIEWLPKLIIEQKVTISRLKELLFGKKKRTIQPKDDKSKTSNAEKLATKNTDNPPASTDAANEENLTGSENTDTEDSNEKKKLKGHGRIPHTAYTDAEEHQITIDDLKAGMPCPSKCKGRLYQFNPATIIRPKTKDRDVCRSFKGI